MAALKEREEKKEQLAGASSNRESRDESRDESLISEERVQNSKRYSMIRKQDVDKTFKMGPISCSGRNPGGAVCCKDGANGEISDDETISC